MKMLILTTLILFLFSGLMACNTEKSHGEDTKSTYQTYSSEPEEGPDSPQFPSGTSNQKMETESTSNQNPGKRVAVIDQSLNMPMGTGQRILPVGIRYA